MTLQERKDKADIIAKAQKKEQYKNKTNQKKNLSIVA